MILTRPRAEGGRDVVGCKVVCTYQGSKDPAPLKIEGTVKSQRKIEGKGNLLVVNTAEGFRSIYFEKATDVTFYVPRPVFQNTDDGYDAARDAYNMGYGPPANRRQREEDEALREEYRRNRW